MKRNFSISKNNGPLGLKILNLKKKSCLKENSQFQKKILNFKKKKKKIQLEKKIIKRYSWN